MRAYKVKGRDIVLTPDGNTRLDFYAAEKLLEAAYELTVDDPLLSGEVKLPADGLGEVGARMLNGHLLYFALRSISIDPSKLRGSIDNIESQIMHNRTASEPRNFTD